MGIQLCERCGFLPAFVYAKVVLKDGHLVCTSLCETCAPDSLAEICEDFRYAEFHNYRLGGKPDLL